jgi:hypothetical protein
LLENIGEKGTSKYVLLLNRIGVLFISVKFDCTSLKYLYKLNVGKLAFAGKKLKLVEPGSRFVYCRKLCSAGKKLLFTDFGSDIKVFDKLSLNSLSSLGLVTLVEENSVSVIFLFRGRVGSLFIKLFIFENFLKG